MPDRPDPGHGPDRGRDVTRRPSDSRRAAWATGPVELHEERSGLRLAGLPVAALVAVAVAAAFLLVAASRRDAAAVAAAALAAGILAVTFARWGGRPAVEALSLRLAYHARRRALPAPAPQGDDPRIAPLRELLPALDISVINLPGDRRLGVGFDGAGWVAAIAVHQDDEILLDQQPRLSLTLAPLADALVVDDIALASVQVLVHVVGSPSGRIPATAVVSSSYRQVNLAGLPVAHQLWVVLRIDAATSGDGLAARGGGADGARQALKRAITHTVNLLEAAGMPARPMDDDALRTALATALNTSLSAVAADEDLPPGSGPGTPARAGPPVAGTRRTLERWSEWQCDDVRHVSWWVRRWADVDDPVRDLVTAVSTSPALSGVLSLTLTPAAGGDSYLQGLVRLCGATASSTETAASALVLRAGSTGFQLRRLDGAHAPAVVATLPLGGGPS